jgi:RNA polymerase sigma-70 factor (ECF subfamily)
MQTFLRLLFRLSPRLVIRSLGWLDSSTSMHTDGVSPEAAFLPLFMTNEAQIRAFIRSLLRDPHAIDDVFQAVALVLWQKFDSYDARRPFGAWARGIAAKEVLSMRRQMANCPTPFSPEIVTSILDEFERVVESRGLASERIDAMERCIEALPSSLRELLALRYGKSMSIERVASSFGRTAAATQRALSRIRKQLAECIEQRLAATSRGEC